MEAVMNIISLPHILIAGLVLCLGMGVLILGSLYINPRLWLQDYPAPMRAKVPPLNAQEKRTQKLITIPVLLEMLFIPVYATYLLRVANGGTITFLSAYLNVFFILQLFNLFDAVVLDLIILTLIQPKFAVLPGTEGMEY